MPFKRHEIEQFAQPGLTLRLVPRMRQAQPDRYDLGAVVGMIFEIGGMMICPDVFLKEIYLQIAAKPRHQMLRALQDEVPAQVRKTD